MGWGAEGTTFMREAIKKAYPGPKWAKRVNLMRPEQVLAVYTKLRNERRI